MPFCANCGASLPRGARFCPSCASPVAEGPPSEERKLATVVFADLVGSTALAEAYERYAVPETGQIFYEAGFANFHLHPPTEVHFKNEERAPLLLVGAGEDNTVPASH